MPIEVFIYLCILGAFRVCLSHLFYILSLCQTNVAVFLCISETIQARTLDRQLENERSTIKSMQTYTEQLESSVKDSGLSAQNQVSVTITVAIV